MKINRLEINTIYNTIASMKLNRFVEDLVCSAGKMLIHDALMMEAFVDIINGNTKIHGKNSIVDQGLIGIINLLAGNSVPNAYLPSVNWAGSPPPYYTYMVVGSDTAYGTINTMTGLKSPIGTAPGTLPNSQSGQTLHPSTVVWQVQWTATWNAGKVSGTLGEVGLYLSIVPTLQAFQASTNPTTPAFFSRMASADNKFTSFSINTSVPLSIAWTFQLTYAT